MQAADVLVLVGVVAALYWVLGPIRRRLQAAIARRLPSRWGGRQGQVIPLRRRSDGTFEHEEKP